MSREGIPALAATAVLLAFVAILGLLSSPVTPTHSGVAGPSPSPGASGDKQEAEKQIPAGARMSGDLSGEEAQSDPQEGIAADRPKVGVHGSIVEAVEEGCAQFRRAPPRDFICPIYNPQFTSGKAADFDPEELVIGVEINGETKAYPLGDLNWREMVNDALGGVPILVTF